MKDYLKPTVAKPIDLPNPPPVRNDVFGWFSEQGNAPEHSGSSHCPSALEVLQRLRDWTISERDAFAEQAKELDRDKMHFEADQKWQKYSAFNTVCLWSEEEIRKIYAKLHPAEASTFTEHVQRQHGTSGDKSDEH